MMKRVSRVRSSIRKSITGKTPPPEIQPDGSFVLPGCRTTYRILKEGQDGIVVDKGSNVTVQAVGRVKDSDTPFWSTRDDDQQPFSYTAGQGDMIQGWERGVIGMKINEKRELTIHHKDAYGKEGFEEWNIPPKATLIFELEVLTIVMARKSRPVADFVCDDEDDVNIGMAGGDAFL